ncbi:netrin receptor UNC5B-b [Strongylocentrotus purpuratus]|uniref:ZU5 domain-containing protein n=1 Tax=Strongylocentrotus purpuratus TaxID=7668 RepID=A0A7M7SWW7_STRPU|nr:netrin receptor UNC5B-b [Strongylocentrotus purpuratus]
MLQNWAETVESSKLIQTLRTALKRARLLEVEETCFTSSSRGTDVASETIHPSKGGTIQLPHYGIDLCIPALALQKECEITLKVLPQPSSVLFAENEAIVSPGVVCEPSGITFEKPLKLVIPHCALLTDPSKAKVTMHFTHGNAKVTKKELSSTGSPRCIVRANDLEVYITHFSIYEMFMAISDYLIGKRVASTPYLPKLMSRLQPQYCHLRLFNDTPGLADLIEKEEEKLDYRKMAPTKKMFVHWDKGELKIICEVKGGYVPENERMKTVSLDDIYILDQNLFSFSVRATGDADVDFKFNFYPHCDEGQAFIAKFSGMYLGLVA